MSVDPATLLRRFADSYERRIAALATRSGESPAAVAAWTVGILSDVPLADDDVVERTFAKAD